MKVGSVIYTYLVSYEKWNGLMQCWCKAYFRTVEDAVGIHKKSLGMAPAWEIRNLKIEKL